MQQTVRIKIIYDLAAIYGVEVYKQLGITHLSEKEEVMENWDKLDEGKKERIIAIIC